MVEIPGILIETIRREKNFVIIGHKDPDGDCMGAQAALFSFLQRLGKNALLLSPGPFNRPDTEKMEEIFHLHLPEETRKLNPWAFILDCSTPERIGHLAQEIEGFKTLVIDHHASGEDFGDIRFVDPQAPSVTVMIASLIKEMGFVTTRKEAEHLFFGLVTDTGFFRHLEKNTGETFRTAADLADRGASPKDAYARMYGGRSLSSIYLLGYLFERVRTAFAGRILYTYETLEDLETFGARSRDSDALYKQLQGVQGCEAVFLIREEKPGECSAGLRANTDIDVGEIARRFNGGGHPKAAGFTWYGGREELTRMILAAFSAILSA